MLTPFQPLCIQLIALRTPELRYQWQYFRVVIHSLQCNITALEFNETMKFTKTIEVSQRISVSRQRNWVQVDRKLCSTVAE